MSQTDRLPIYEQTVQALREPLPPPPNPYRPARRPDLARRIWWAVAVVLFVVGVLLLAGAK